MNKTENEIGTKKGTTNWNHYYWNISPERRGSCGDDGETQHRSAWHF